MKPVATLKIKNRWTAISINKFLFESAYKIPIILTTLILVAACSNNKSDSASKKLNYDKVLGKARSMEVTDFTAIEKFGKYEINKIVGKTITLFNYQGKKTQESEFIDGINLSSVDYYTYDGLGFLSEVITKGGSWENRVVYSLDARGKRLEENYYEHDGTLKWRSFYKYDPKGLLTEEISYDGNGSLKFHRYFKYDEKGNKIEVWLVNESGYLEENYSYAYDIHGNLLEERSYNPINITFNSSNNAIKHKKSDKLYYRSVNVYFESINCVLHTHYPSGNPSELTSTYYKEFDKNGNWLTRTMDDPEDKKMTITIRKIEYY